MVGNWCKIIRTVLHIFFAQIIHSVVGPNFDLYILKVFFTSSHYKKGNDVSQIPPIKTWSYKKHSSVIMPAPILGLTHTAEWALCHKRPKVDIQHCIYQFRHLLYQQMKGSDNFLHRFWKDLLSSQYKEGGLFQNHHTFYTSM